MKRNNLSNYKAIVLAGGAGTRLYPVTKEIPKPLLPINRKPIINHILDLLYYYQVKDVAVLIRSNFNDEFRWWKKRYYPKNNIKIVEEKRPLGTFGGLCLLKNWLSSTPFFLVNGDDLIKINLSAMAAFHRKKEIPVTIALVKVQNPEEYGVVLCKEGFVSKFLEKPKNPPSKYINSGYYLISPEIFDYHPGLKFSMIEKDIFPRLAKEKKLAGFKSNDKWMDCGTWERYGRALNEWK
jgi:NDP-sugar pyrophosphorylase family protein